MPNIYMTSQYTLDGVWRLWHGPVLDKTGREIPDRVVPRVSDEHLDYWGKVFEANNLYAHGIRFEYFITAPAEFMDVLARRRIREQADDAFEPLLPAQARVARQIELQTPLGHLTEALENIPTAVMRDGTLIEPLHHSRYPRNHTRRVPA